MLFGPTGSDGCFSGLKPSMDTWRRGRPVDAHMAELKNEESTADPALFESAFAQDKLVIKLDHRRWLLILSGNERGASTAVNHLDSPQALLARRRSRLRPGRDHPLAAAAARHRSGLQPLLRASIRECQPTTMPLRWCHSRHFHSDEGYGYSFWGLSCVPRWREWEVYCGARFVEKQREGSPRAEQAVHHVCGHGCVAGSSGRSRGGEQSSSGARHLQLPGSSDGHLEPFERQRRCFRERELLGRAWLLPALFHARGRFRVRGELLRLRSSGRIGAMHGPDANRLTLGKR